MTALSTSISQRVGRAILYLEIEGFPYAYGTAEKSGAWFPSSTFEGIKPFLRGERGNLGSLPMFSEHSIDHFLGTVGMGSINVALVDQDDTLAGLFAPRRTDDRLLLAGGSGAGVDLTATYATQLLISRDPMTDGEVAAWPNAPTIFIGGETITATGKSGSPDRFTTLTRGRYRSSAQVHTATGTARTAIGAILTQYPRFVRGRQVWLRLGVDADDDDDCETIWHGVIANYDWTEESKTVVLQLDDATAILDGVPLFTDWFAQFRGPEGAAVQTIPVSNDDYPPEIWVAGMATDFAQNTVFHAFVPSLNSDGNGAALLPAFVALKRGASGSDDGQLDYYTVISKQVFGLGAPFNVKEYLGQGDDDTGQTRGANQALAELGTIRPCILVHGPNQLASGETATDGTDVWSFHTIGDHPLQVVLQVLLSTGLGTNYGTATPTATGRETSTTGYDTLPRDWGVGMKYSDVDIDTFEKFIRRHQATEAVRLVIQSPVLNARTFITSLLRPFGYYLVPSFSGLSVRKYSEPTALEIDNAQSITLDDLIVDPRSRQPRKLVGPSPSKDIVAGSLKFAFGPELGEDGQFVIRRKPNRRILAIDEADFVRRANATTIEITAECVQRGSTPGFGVGRGSASAGSWGTSMLSPVPADYVERRLLKAISSRFAVPPYRMTIEVPIDIGIDLALGDWVTFSDSLGGAAKSKIVNAASSSRGLSSVVFEIWSKRINLATCSVELGIAQTGASTNPTRSIAPACILTAWTDGSKTATVQQHAFTDSNVDDSSAFSNGDSVRVYSPDFTSRSNVAEINGAPGPTSVVLNKAIADLGVTPASGWVILHADFNDTWANASNLAAVKAKYAYRADEGPDLNGTAPHVHS